MNWLKNLKFVRKIQGGYTFLGMVATLAMVVGFYQLISIQTVKDQLIVEYIQPKAMIENSYSNYREMQFIMMQFSIPEFSGKFGENVKKYQQSSELMDTTIDSLLNSQISDEIKTALLEVKEIWEEYKMIVADGIISASASQMFDMAAEVATTSGEDIGSKLQYKFDEINSWLEIISTNLNAQIDDTVLQAKYITIGSALLGSFIYIFCVFFLAPTISSPLNKIQRLVKQFALGNYNLDIKVESKDEIGELTETLISLQQAQKEKIEAASQIASGSMTKVIPASEHDDLAHAFNKVVDTIESILKEAEKISSALQEGNLNIQGEENKFSGGWQSLLQGMNMIIISTIEPLDEAAKVLKEMAEGDLTKRVEGNYKGYFAEIKNNINVLGDSLENALSEVSYGVEMVSNSANEISSNSDKVAEGASEQSNQASEVAFSVNEMTKTIMDNTQNASLAAETAKEAGNKAKKGGEVVNNTLSGMLKIAEVVERSAATVEELGRSSEQIDKIIQVIDDIADQTNLLALNAAIEAARAGDQGRGFAVVADEVRKLAERTTGATKEIAVMIKKIQSDTGNAVVSMKEGTEEVEKGKKLASEAGVVLEDIIKEAVKVKDVAAQVATASEEQSTSAELISKNIETIADVTAQNVTGTEEIAKSSVELLELTVRLRTMIKKFKIDSSSRSDNYSVRNNGKLISRK
ncbi:MAG: HAMP domain-containing protein [Melioribacteraceae bacterium]|nr:HAMP domain-containing protein [Melioribacteraceae bacterium]